MKDSHSFVDEVEVTATSGRGGDGMVSFRREKFVPQGGPNGGDGGRGGNVLFVADRNLGTLTDLRYRHKVSAENGVMGGSRGKTGATGATLEVRVPVGTFVFDAEDRESAEPLADLSADGQTYVAARGGKGGLGNIRFKTSTRQAPDFATPGGQSETRELRLCLKLLADVAFVGLPNAGKSTLLSRISAARPRVAAYPFTTLVPSLGVVEVDDRRFVAADIPGLIEGASDGAGLGDRFLRHIERTRVLAHVLDVGAMLFEERDPAADYATIRNELESYKPELANRREIVLLNKVDLVAVPESLDALQASFEARGSLVLRVSGATGGGTAALIRELLAALDAVDAEEEALVETAGAESTDAHSNRSASG